MRPDPVEMVRVQQLCRAAAILMTAGVGVRLWSFDLEAYFRKTGNEVSFSTRCALPLGLACTRTASDTHFSFVLTIFIYRVR